MSRKRHDLTTVKAQYPSVVSLDWHKAFRQDPMLYGRIMNDILKADLTGHGRPGPRPALDRDEATRDEARQRFIQLTDEEYTVLPFSQAVSVTSKGMSIRGLARKTGLDKNTVHRLMKGTQEPDAYELELFASAFGHRPAWFVEYRIGYVLQMLHEHMLKFPESSVGPYTKVRNALGKKSA